jgi:alkylhydroperoxidase family enzyme
VSTPFRLERKGVAVSFVTAFLPAPPENFFMSRISRLAKDQVDQQTGEIYDIYQKERGNIPNMFRTVAHRPEIFRTMIAHFRAVMNSGTLPAKLKELVIVRTSQINHCEY